MDPVEFAALRAALLNRMGEAQVARALVQDVDSANYDAALATAAFDAYLATGDVLGMCPVAQLRRTCATTRVGNDAAICAAYSAKARTRSASSTGRSTTGSPRDRRAAGAALRRCGGRGPARSEHRVEQRRGADPVAHSPSRALGVELPAGLRSERRRRFDCAATC
jgi:hypothetical protein